MRIGNLILGLAIAALSVHMGWAQLDTETPAQPSLDPTLIDAPFVPGELVVGLEPGDLALPLLAMEMVGTITSQNPPIRSFVIRLHPNITMQDAGEFLRALPGVRYVEPNYLAFAIATPNDPSFSQQYGPQRIQANLAWDIWQPQQTVYLAILDTGIDAFHPDLTRKMRRRSDGRIYGYNTINNNEDTTDRHSHGTHCAGIAAADINNGIGIAGVAAWNPSVPNSHTYVQLMPVKVLNDSGSGTWDSVARGITWAADNGAHILSMSLGGSGGAQQLEDAVNYAWSRGCLVVAAAGNGGSSSPSYPAYYTNCIAVAATDSSDTLAYFSQYGWWVDIAAPGVNVYSTIPNNSYTSYSGTSMACPHVAGAAAVLWSHNSVLTNAELRAALERNVDPYIPYQGRTIAPGAGRLNVYRALLDVGSGDPTQPRLGNLSLNPSRVTGGNPVTGTVNLTAPAQAGGFVVNLSSSNTNVATVPSTVTVPEGATSATFTVSTRAVTTSTSVTISASAGGITRTASLRVNPFVAPQSLTINPTSVVGGNPATGTVTLTSPAPPEGFVVNLSSSNTDAATVPSTITIPEGFSSASFTISTRAVSAPTSVTISASAEGVTRTATLTVNPFVALQSVSVRPSAVWGGSTATGTVTLTYAALSGGFVVNLSSSNTNVATVPNTVTVPEGSASVTFTISTQPVTSSTSVTITATAEGVTRTATFRVDPFVALHSLTIDPTTVHGGNPAMGRITLTGAAPPDGFVVNLSSSNTNVATVPSTVTVPAGATSATFTISTQEVNAPTNVAISASAEGVTRTASLNVRPLVTIHSLTVQPTSVVGGSTATGTVTLTAPAPTGGAIVNLSSSNTNVATVPSTVTVPAGATRATFTISTQAVANSTSVTIAASVGGVTRTASLRVSPSITLHSLTIRPASIVGGSTATGIVTLTAPAPSGGFVVNLSSSNTNVATVPSTVTVPAGTTSATFTISTQGVASSTSVTITASAGGVARTATLRVEPSVTLQSLTIRPTSVWGGNRATGTIILNTAAPAGGIVVELRSSSGRATVPNTVVVPAGATQVNFTILTWSASQPPAETVTITATYNGVSRTAQLTVWY